MSGLLPDTGNLFQQLRQFIAEDAVQGWDNAWKANVTPWDAGAVQPPLRSFLESGRFEFPKSGYALVPGCGRGYDAIFIASKLGFETIAVDISPTAVNEANELLSLSALPASTKIAFQLDDFFSLGSALEERHKFDLIYDYTFFVALPPALRSNWGEQMKKLLKPGGYLITLVFPLDPPQDVGPPFYVRPEHYVDALGEGWEKVLYYFDHSGGHASQTPQPGRFLVGVTASQDPWPGKHLTRRPIWG